MGFLAALAPIAGAVVGNLFNSKSNDKAADAQVQGNQKAIESQERMFNRSVELQEPWRQSGVGALNIQNALLGINPTTGLETPGGGTVANTPVTGVSGAVSNPAQDYLTANRDVAQAYQDNVSNPAFRNRFPTAEKYARWHYDTFSPNEPNRQWGTGTQVATPGQSTGVFTGGGRDLTGTSAAPKGNALASQSVTDRQADAYELFNNSGFAKSMLETTDSDMQRMLGAYASGGKAMSGAGLKALNDVNRRNTNQAFGQYYDALGGISGTGANISGSMAGNALATGRTIGGLQQNIGNTRASSYANNGANWGNALGSALGAVDFGKLFG